MWKTIDAGITWQPVFDGQPIASIGALEVAPSNPNVLYAGTGESDIRSALSSGDGVYKSTDGGQTWKNVGLHDSRQISRIVVDPTNADIVYVGALGHAYGPNERARRLQVDRRRRDLDARAGQRPEHRRLRSRHCGRQPEHSFRRHLEHASSAVEHLCSAARSGRRPVSLHRQRSHLDAADGQRPSRWRMGPRRRCGLARRQARLRVDGGRQEVRLVSLRRWRQHLDAGQWRSAHHQPRLVFHGHHHRSQQSGRHLHAEHRAVPLERRRQDDLDRARRARRR